MLFNSIAFLLFLPIVVLIYYSLSHSWRWLWLLAASCFFYMFFKPEYILILFFTIVIDFYAGIKIEQSQNKYNKKAWLIASLIANIGILAVFKYFNFINGNISGIADWLHIKNPIPSLNILLPIGLSFHTFQAMSYTIEVYRGNQQAEKHFGIYSLYVMFFPQLVAGPIERPQNIIHQLKEKKEVIYQNFSDGAKLILWGLFKKVCIADRLAVFVNHVYKAPADHNGFEVLVAIVFFSFQIYCDFSGYTDIAIGSAKILGIDLMKNFNRPYAAKSVTEFWKRWHISLSTWFRDYLYIPLGGNRKGTFTMYSNVLIVFLLSGLWHGANWTFVLWGFIHGLAVIVESQWIRLRSKINDIDVVVNNPIIQSISLLLTFAFVSVAWMIFRAPSIENVQVLFHQLGTIEWQQVNWNVFGESQKAEFKLGIIAIFLLEVIQYITKKEGVVQFLNNQYAAVRWTIYLVFTFLMLLFGSFHKSQEFIYFQF